MHIPEARLEDFHYTLPEEKIAKYPLKNRKASKLLHYDSGTIVHKSFSDISDSLPRDASLWFNNTKVIPARLFFTKSTGAIIEIFLLQPELPTSVIAKAMLVKGKCTWSCMIGNLKRWKEGDELEMELKTEKQSITLKAVLVDREERRVAFSWSPESLTFATIITTVGELPLPPYFQRKPEKEDAARYQTVYAAPEGAVAAPTAGLHFTDSLLEELELKGVHMDYLTLHVGAGTFQPVKEENISKHPMHSEQIAVSLEKIKKLAVTDWQVIAVGTTSMRTLESLYWFGTQLLLEGDSHFSIKKLQPYGYTESDLPSRQVAFEQIASYMEGLGLDEIHGSTEIFIFPGYTFRVCNGLITNFHLPHSTLIMLIAAFIGNDWKKIYNEALQHEYRFLSYGDSSLLIPKKG